METPSKKAIICVLFLSINSLLIDCSKNTTTLYHKYFKRSLHSVIRENTLFDKTQNLAEIQVFDYDFNHPILNFTLPKYKYSTRIIPLS